MAGRLSILPAELRLQIYRELMLQANGKVFIGSNFSTDLSSQLLRVSRLIYSEALPILYGENTFISGTSWNGLDGFARFVENIGPTARNYLKSVELRDVGLHREHGIHGLFGRYPLRNLRSVEMGLHATTLAEEESALDLCENAVMAMTRRGMGMDMGDDETEKHPILEVVRRNAIADCRWTITLNAAVCHSGRQTVDGYKKCRAKFSVRTKMRTSDSGDAQVGKEVVLEVEGDGEVEIWVLDREMRFRYGMVPHCVPVEQGWRLERVVEL